MTKHLSWVTAGREYQGLYPALTIWPGLYPLSLLTQDKLDPSTQGFLNSLTCV